MGQQQDPFFKDFFSPFFDEDRPLVRNFPVLSSNNALRLDLKEDTDKFTLHVETPGLEKEQVNMHVDGNVFTVSADYTKTQKDEGETYRWQERRSGHVERSVRLPVEAENLAKEKIK